MGLSPVHLVDVKYDANKKTNTIVTCAEGMQVLRSAAFQKCPLVVVSIVGPARSGKSTLINNLLKLWGIDGAKFETSAAHRSCTHGIWMWPVPLDMTHSDASLVILDVEGSQNVDKNVQTSREMYCLAYLISSSLVWNSRENVNLAALKDLATLQTATNIIYSDAFATSLREATTARKTGNLGLNPRACGIFPLAYGFKYTMVAASGGFGSSLSDMIWGRQPIADEDSSDEEDGEGSDFEESGLSTSKNPEEMVKAHRRKQRHLQELSEKVGTRLIWLMQDNLSLQGTTPSAHLTSILEPKHTGDLIQHRTKKTHNNCKSIALLFPESRRDCIRIPPPRLYPEELQRLSEIKWSDLVRGSPAYVDGLKQFAETLKKIPLNSSGKVPVTGNMLLQLLMALVDTINSRGIVDWQETKNRLQKETNLGLVRELKVQFKEEVATRCKQLDLQNVRNEAELKKTVKSIEEGLKRAVSKDFEEKVCKNAPNYRTCSVDLEGAMKEAVGEQVDVVKSHFSVQRNQGKKNVQNVLSNMISNRSLNITRNTMQSEVAVKQEFAKIAEMADTALKGYVAEYGLEQEELNNWLQLELLKYEKMACAKQEAKNKEWENKIKKNLWQLASATDRANIIIGEGAHNVNKLRIGHSNKKEDLAVFALIDEDGRLMTKPVADRQEFALYLPLSQQTCTVAMRECKYYWSGKSPNRFWLDFWVVGSKVLPASRLKAHKSGARWAFYSQNGCGYAKRIKGIQTIGRSFHSLGCSRTHKTIKPRYEFEMSRVTDEKLVNDCLLAIRQQVTGGAKIEIAM